MILLKQPVEKGQRKLYAWLVCLIDNVIQSPQFSAPSLNKIAWRNVSQGIEMDSVLKRPVLSDAAM